MNLINKNQSNPIDQATTHLFKTTQGHKYTFYVDVETTGGDPIRNDLLEICCLVTEKNKFEIIDKFHSYVRPRQINQFTWSEHAEAVHGISKDRARSFPETRQVAYNFLMFCDKYRDKRNNSPQLFVCHALRQSFLNAKTNEKVWGLFDFRFMEWFFRKETESESWYYAFSKVFNDSYCLSTIWLAQQLGYGKDQLKDENGNLIYTKSGRTKFEGNGLAVWAKRINFDLSHHSAESDTECCLRVHEFLSKKI